MQNLLPDIVAAWREAERIAGQDRGGPEGEEALRVAGKLRELYRLVAGARPPQEEIPGYRALLDDLRSQLASEPAEPR